MKTTTKVPGAFVIGFALVAGSYVVTHFGGNNQTTPTTKIYAVAAKTDARTYIKVTDKNGDGIEDWQEEFVNETPLLISNSTTASSSYVAPTTVTDQMGVKLFQSILEAKGRGNIGPDTTQVITNTANVLRQTAVTDTLSTLRDITVIENSPEAIRTYANTLGQILLNNNVPGSENELDIITRAIKTNDPTELNKLDPIIAMYKNLRDQTIGTPVPRGFEKQHLDLINVYQGVYSTLDGMKLVFSDPVVALLRTKRYQDDALGLVTALGNMYTSFSVHPVFEANDPALVFGVFAPKR